jgi:hypothetical protein
MNIDAHDEMRTLKGHWKLDVYRGDLRGAEHLLETIEGDNLIVTLGKQILLDRLFAIGGPPGQLTHMGVGTDSTAAAVGQNKLNPSVAGTVSLLAFDSTPTRASQTVTCIRTWDTATGNFSWNELGLANSATNDGTHLFNRIVIGPFAKTSAVSIVVTVTITQT